MRTQAKPARELVVGDYIVTAVGYAPITAINPYRGLLDVHLDIFAERSTRPKSETRVLNLYPGERVRFYPGTDAPSLNAERVAAKKGRGDRLRRATGHEGQDAT